MAELKSQQGINSSFGYPHFPSKNPSVETFPFNWNILSIDEERSFASMLFSDAHSVCHGSLSVNSPPPPTQDFVPGISCHKVPHITPQ